VNAFTEAEPSPLTAGAGGAILKVDESAERAAIERLRAFRNKRNASEAKSALAGLRDAAKSGANVMPASIRCAEADVTTGEWADALRGVFGEYRAPTGVVAREMRVADPEAERIRVRVRALAPKLGRPLKLLVGKPGLDGHSNGAEQIAVRARDLGMEVVYEGIRVTPAEIVQSARDEGVHVIGLSILSGSHGVLVLDVLGRLRDAGVRVPVVVGGIIPEDDAARLRAAGVARVYTPKDFALNRIMSDIVALAEPAAVAAE
jgi:(2R)-ethylmalonyl-CoA mutase